MSAGPEAGDEVVFVRTGRQLVAYAVTSSLGAIVLGLFLALQVLVANGSEGFVVVAVLAAFVIGWVGLTFRWRRHERIVLAHDGLRVTRLFGSTTVPWRAIDDVVIRPSLGLVTVRVSTTAETFGLPVPSDGPWWWHDAGFEEKVARLEAWWRAGGPPH